MRVRIDLGYDGSAFHGWARQPGLRTVQGELERALDTALRSPGHEVTVAGRTDTGVHARGQVCHVDDVPADRVDPLARQLNGILDGDVRVHRVSPAPEGFDARFAAVWRRYAYRIADRPELVDPLTRGHVLRWGRPLDERLMNAAAQGLLGEHDFASFCKRREGATTVRALLDLHWARDGAGVLVGSVRADAFCHHMVRSLVGCLVAIGEGRHQPGWAAEVLGREARDPAVSVVPAHGLVLEEVGYPPDDRLAARVEESRRVRTR